VEGRLLAITGLILVGLVLLCIGAEGLVRGSASLALRAGVTPLVVGLTVVAFGTSSPELVVSTKAAFLGQGSIALGNAVGSNIFNVAVILGLSTLVRPMRVNLQLIRFDMPVMIGVSLLAFWMFRDGALSRVESAVLVLGLFAYIFIIIRMARRETNRKVELEFTEGNPKTSRSVGLDVGFVLGGLGLLVLGARFFVLGAVDLARIWGVSEAVIGLTIVAAGTSMPELATSMVAAFRKQEDIAIGNIVGSNIFNILAVLGVSGLIHPFDGNGIRPADFYFMLGTSILLLPLMRWGLRVSRIEGLLLLVAYGIYLAMLWPK
jgi:cation:H+ antiporter